MVEVSCLCQAEETPRCEQYCSWKGRRLQPVLAFAETNKVSQAFLTTVQKTLHIYYHVATAAAFTPS